MSNPDPEIEGRDPSDDAERKRPAGEIRLRDFDRIQERTPFTLKPIHFKLAGAGAALLIALGIATGFLLGRGSSTVENEPGKAIPVETAPEPAVVTALPTEVPPVKREVRGSVMAVPEPEPRPVSEPEISRRGLVDPPIDLTPVWWIEYTATWCPFTCVEPLCACAVNVPACPGPLPVETQESTNGNETGTEPGSGDEDTATAVPGIADAGTGTDVTVPADAGNGTDVAAPTDAGTGTDVTAPADAPRRDAAKPAETAQKDQSVNNAPAVRKPTPSKPAADKTIQKMPPPRRFSVQVRSFREKAVADEFVTGLKARGYNAFIVEWTDQSGTAWFRVRTGSFTTAAEASAFAAQLNAKEAEQAIPVEEK